VKLGILHGGYYLIGIVALLGLMLAVLGVEAEIDRAALLRSTATNKK